MKTVKNCLKNSRCQLWQVLCDGNPCIVDTAIEANSHSTLSPKNNKIWNLSRFHSGEIIDLAVKIKKMGSQFYKKLAKKAPNRQIKKLLLCLAAEEEQHQVKFRELGRDFVPVVALETYSGEYFEYVGSTVETHMFKGTEKIEQLMENVRSGLDIIKLATDFEKDTILFFNGFRNLVPEDKQAVIDGLIIEEQIHLIKLTKLRKDVMAQNGRQIIKSKRYLKDNSVPEIMPLVV